MRHWIFWSLVGLFIIAVVIGGILVVNAHAQTVPADTIFSGRVPIEGQVGDSMVVHVLEIPGNDSLLASFRYIQAGSSRWVTAFRMYNVYSDPGGGIAVSLIQEPESLADHARRVGVTWRDLLTVLYVYFGGK